MVRTNRTECSSAGQVSDADDRAEVTWCTSVQHFVRHVSKFVLDSLQEQWRLMSASVTWSLDFRRKISHTTAFILNNKLLRILQNAPRETPVVKLYANFSTLTLPELHTGTYQILKFIHNCIYHQNKPPSIFSNYFSQNYMIHTHNTRTREHLHLEHTYSSLQPLKVRFCRSPHLLYFMVRNNNLGPR